MTRKRVTDGIIQNASGCDRRNLLEPEAKSICKAYGMWVPSFKVAKSAEEASKAAERLGYPIVLKVICPDILHKTDAGGIMLDLRSSPRIKQGFSKIVRNVKRCKPNVAIVGVLVEKMMPQGVEVIVGGLTDPQFGLTLMFGLGGVLVDIFKDTTLRMGPIRETEAREMVHELKGSSILRGYRGKTPADEDAIVDVLLRASNLMQDYPQIDQMDLNPVLVYKKGACVVDAKIVLHASA